VVLKLNTVSPDDNDVTMTSRLAEEKHVRRRSYSLVVVDRSSDDLSVTVRVASDGPGRCGHVPGPAMSLGDRVDTSEVQIGVDGAGDGAQCHQHQKNYDNRRQHLMTS